MKQQKLLLSLTALTGTVLLVGVYRTFDGVDERPAPAVASAGMSAAPGPGAPAVAPAAAVVDPMSLLAGWRALPPPIGDLFVAIGRPVERGSPRAREDAVPRIGASRPVRGPADPGDRSLRGASKRELGVAGVPYAVPSAGRKTIVTSGRRIGPPPDVRVRGSARFGLDGTATVRAFVCVNARGRPTEVRIEDGSGAAAVDRQVAAALMADRFRPLRHRGRAVEFCEPVTVVVSS